MSGRLDIDFARGAAAPAWAWALLAAGAALLVVAVLLLTALWDRHQAAAERADRLARALQREAPQAARRSSATARGPSRENAQSREAAAQTEALRIWADLHRPWLPLLDRLEAQSGRDRQLTQVSVNGSFTEAMIQGEARNLDEAWRVVRGLDAGAPIGTVQLLQHEWREGEDAPRVVVYRLRATLTPALAGARAEAAVPQRRAALAGVTPDHVLQASSPASLPTPSRPSDGPSGR